jgi:hypothetical protein
MPSLRYAAAHRPLLPGYQSSKILGHKPQLFLRSRTRWTVLAARSSSSSDSSITRGDEKLKDRTREQILNASPSSSSYDTAWAAMVPAPGSALAPRFPQCVDWILQNQRGDGSWGLGGSPAGDDPLLRKDALSSTLACVLALRTWGVGDEHVAKG